MSTNGEIAQQHAMHAASCQSEDEQVEAIGQGLAAVAYALTDVAEALRDVASSRTQR